MDNYKIFATTLAYAAGARIKKDFKMDMDREWKADSSPVTATDYAINQMVLDAVASTYPAHSVLAEEGSNLIEGSEYTWVCDPLDGTIPFTHGIPTSVFSLALTQNGQVLLGVIYDPYMDRLFFAEKNKGATCNGEKISVSSQKSLRQSLLDIELPPRLPYTIHPVKEKLLGKGARCLTIASILYGAMLVAGGELIAALCTCKTAHDGATAKIIVEEAGGKVTDLFGNDQRYDREINGYIASNGLIHDELLTLVKESMEHCA